MVLKNPCLSFKIWMIFFIFIKSFSSEGGQYSFQIETTIHPFLSLFFFTIHDVNWLFVYRYSLSNYLCFNPLMFFNHVN